MTKLSLVLVISLAALHTCVGLSCLRCSEVRCSWASGCAYGKVKDVCGCCDVCAKGPGDSCGGMWLLEGKCGIGLKCEPNEGQPNLGFPEEYLDGKCAWENQPEPAELQVEAGGALLGGGAGGNPGVAGLAGPSQIGKKKKLAKQHSIQMFGNIPQRYLELLKKRRPKRSAFLGRRPGGTQRLASVHSHKVSSGIPADIRALLKEFRKRKNRA